MWIVGIMSALAYILLFAQSELYASMCFQVYYLVISIYGLMVWQREKKSVIVYRSVGVKQLLLAIVAVVLIFVVLFGFLHKFTGDPMPAIDAVIASLSIVATYWLGKLYIQQWLLWIIANILSVVLFFSQELYLTALLYVFYTVCAVYGFVHWHKKGVKLSSGGVQNEKNGFE